LVFEAVEPRQLLSAAPVLAHIDNVNVKAGQMIFFQVLATDPDGDAITFSYSGTNLPGGNSPTFNPSTGIFQWVPINTTTDDFPITFTATDGTDPVSQTVNLHVTGNGPPPTFSVNGTPVSNTNGPGTGQDGGVLYVNSVNSSLTRTITATAFDGGAVTLSLNPPTNATSPLFTPQAPGASLSGTTLTVTSQNIAHSVIVHVFATDGGDDAETEVATGAYNYDGMGRLNSLHYAKRQSRE